MVKTIRRLTALKLSRPLRPGMYADGAGLYLQVTGNAKSWIYRYAIGGRAREMGLGSLNAVTLADARSKAAACRALRQNGIDPIEARKAERAQEALAAAKAITFKEAAERYIAAHRAGWKAAKHTKLWQTTLAAYACPVIGQISVQDADTAAVLKILEPIWRTKPATASRLRGRIEAVLDFAKVRGWRDAENPARWRGHLAHLLPARSKVRRVRHHPALPYAELPEFMAALRKDDNIGARALEFTILTGARTGEVIGATKDEINAAAKIWTVPADRMKAGKEHRVPLSQRALAILKEMTDPANGDHAFVFPGRKGSKPLASATMGDVLERMGRDDVTVHGFRSTFRDWAAETTNYPSEVVEMALAHTVGNQVEAAYRRGDLFDKRRRLMAEWAAYCSGAVAARGGSAVVPLRGAGRS